VNERLTDMSQQAHGITTPPSYDVTAVGSTMLRLAADRGETLGTADTLSIEIAGAESNTLMALARLGLRTAWATKVGDNPLSRRVVREIRAGGVDVSHVHWTTADERAELVFTEPGVPPRPTMVHYDRRGAAIDSLQLADLDIASLLDTRVYHFTGILPSLSPACQETALELKRQAHERGVTLSFDINYRHKLWSTREAAPSLRELSKGVGLFFISLRDAPIFGLTGTAREISIAARAELGASVVIVKDGAAGALAYDGRQVYVEPGLRVEIVDRLGAGDAFCAGVLYGYLHGSLSLGLKYGCRMAALKLTTKGDRFVFEQGDLTDEVYASEADIDR